MTLHPQAVYTVPEDTARVARAAFPKGNIYLRMHDELGLCWPRSPSARGAQRSSIIIGQAFDREDAGPAQEGIQHGVLLWQHRR